MKGISNVDMPLPEILVLLVTFNGADTVSELLASLKAATVFDHLSFMVIDNASQDQTLRLVRSFHFPRLTLRCLPENIGVARAYNMGIQKARALGIDWIFMLDQDSTCDPDCLEKLIRSADTATRRGLHLGAVCPTVRSRYFPSIVHLPYCWRNHGFDLVQEEPPPNAAAVPNPLGLVNVDSTITSGTLYNVTALHQVKGFRGEYFIDFIDHECHMRMRRAGWDVGWLKEATLYHRLGREQKFVHKGFFLEHAPLRYYYMARNMSDGLYRIGGVKALLRFGTTLIDHAMRLLRFGHEPGSSILFMLKGIKDAIYGNFGPYRSDG